MMLIWKRLIDYKNRNAESPNVEVDRNFNPFRTEGNSSSVSGKFKKDLSQGWESLYVGLESKSNNLEPDFSGVQFESDDVAPSMFDGDDSLQEVQTTFQLHKKYIVSTIKSGILVIDQNKAHQRILYEEFLRNFTLKEATSQQLLFPLVFHYSKPEIHVIEQLREQLESTGFIISKLRRRYFRNHRDTANSD